MLPRINSKWNYTASGLNIGIAIWSAVDGLLSVAVMACFFAIYNWYIAEGNRRYDETDKSETENKE